MDRRCKPGYLLLSERKSGLPLIVDVDEMKASYERRIQYRARVLRDYNQPNDSDTVSNPFRAEWAPQFDTMRVFSRDGRIPQGTEVRVLVLPGAGWITSTHWEIREMIRALSVSDPTLTPRELEILGSGGKEEDLDRTDPQRKALAASIAETVQKELGNSRVRAAVEVIDVPGHGVGPSGADYLSGERTLGLFEAYLEDMHEGAPQIPIVVLGWSAMGPVAKELAVRRPDLVKGLIVLSSIEGRMPRYFFSDKVRAKYKDELSGLLSFNIFTGQIETLSPNTEGFSWFTQVNAEMPAFSEANLNRVPTLVIFSSRDGSVIPQTADTFRKMAAGGADWASTLSNNKNLQFRRHRDYWLLEMDHWSHEPFFNFRKRHDFSLPAYQALDLFLKTHFRPRGDMRP